MKRSPHNTPREREIQALFAWVAGFGDGDENKWRVGNHTKPAKTFANNVWHEFMDSILDGNPEPSNVEYDAANPRAESHSKQTHALLRGHLEAWVKAKKNAKVLLMKDSERSATIDKFLGNSRPRNVMTEFLANELLQSILFDKKIFTPEEKAAELFYSVLKLKQHEIENVGVCRECVCAFWKPRSDALDCSPRCHNRYHRKTDEGRRRRARDKRRSRAAKRKLKGGAQKRREREETKRIDRLLKTEEKTRKRN
jgi:hypothetical protein